MCIRDRPGADASVSLLFIGTGIVLIGLLGQAVYQGIMYTLDTPLAQLVALGALQEFHVVDGTAGVLAVGGDEAAGPASAVVGHLNTVLALIGQVANDLLKHRLGQIVVLAAEIGLAPFRVHAVAILRVVGAVSYTHLDVYKRQDPASA